MLWVKRAKASTMSKTNSSSIALISDPCISFDISNAYRIV